MKDSHRPAHTCSPPYAGEVAYRVPFRVHRGSSSSFLIENISQEPIKHLRFSMVGNGIFSAQNHGTLLPADSVEVFFSGHDLAKDSLLVLRWFRQDGEEYLWHISF